MIELKENGHLYINSIHEKVMLYDKYNGKIFDIPFDIYKQYKNNFMDEFNEKLNGYLCDTPVEDTNANETLQHLRFITTNDCNLKCTYCYANEGSYNKPIGRLSKNDAKEVIDCFYNYFESIKQISFFGGEPLLNYEIVIYICEYISSLFANKKINNMPMFSMVTNCTIIDDNILDMIETYNIQVVASLDGPKKVNDIQRVKKDGIGTFDVINENIKRYQKITNVDIECTYTNNHVNLHCNYSDLEAFFRDSYGVERVNIIKVIENKNMPTDLELSKSTKDSIMYDYSLEKMKRQFYEDTFNDVFVRMLIVFNSNVYIDSYCDAGLKQFTVNFNGNIYPCQGFLDNENYILGNANDIIPKIKENSINILNKFFKSNNKVCQKCGNKRFCQFCISFADESYIDSERCRYVHELCDQSIDAFLDVMISDNKRYDEVIENIYSKIKNINNYE